MLTAIVFIFLLREIFFEAKNLELEIISKFEDVEVELAAETNLIKQFVGGGRSYAENHLKFLSSQVSPWFPNFRYDSKIQGSYLHDMSSSYKAKKFGNLTSKFDIKKITKEKNIEINMALDLGNYISVGLFEVKASSWFYYTSSDFIYLAPFVDSKEFFFSLNTTKKEFFINATPINNPKRAGFWTSVYVDEAGLGLMVTYSEPVYDGDKFKGSISMDLTLDQFNTVLSRKDFKFGEFVLFNNSGQVLSHPGEVGSKDKQISKIEQWVNEDIIFFLKRLNGEQQMGLTFVGNKLVFSRSFADLNSTLLVAVSPVKFIFKIFFETFTLLVLLVIVLILLFKIRKIILADNFLQQSLAQNTKMAALGQMASGVAHEINNPLAIIFGKTELALMMVNSESELDRNLLREQLIKVLETVDRIVKIIKGLKAFARNGEKDSFLPCSLRNWFETTYEICIESLNSNAIKVYISEIPDLQILARESQLSQVLLNLLNNSIDALKETTDKKISITFQQDGKFLLIYIRNSGPKIPKLVQAHLMEPFFTTKAPGAGTGLGLSISLGIMKEHNGDLFFVPNDSETCFVIKVPVVG